MFSDSSSHLSVEKSFRIKQDDGFFSRLMSKETSMANTSSRVFSYYGETSVAVPFTWEEQPGTPKHPLSETSLPPLTPPPSYYSNYSRSSNYNKQRNSKANNIFSCILPRFRGSRKSHDFSPSSSRSSSSSSWSLLVYPSSSYSTSDKDEGLSFSSSKSVIGSFLKHRASNGFRGCYPFRNMKNAIATEHSNY